MSMAPAVAATTMSRIIGKASRRSTAGPALVSGSSVMSAARARAEAEQAAPPRLAPEWAVVPHNDDHGLETNDSGPGLGQLDLRELAGQEIGRLGVVDHARTDPRHLMGAL